MRRIAIGAAGVLLVGGLGAAAMMRGYTPSDAWNAIRRHSPTDAWVAIRRHASEAWVVVRSHASEAWVAVRSHLPLDTTPARQSAAAASAKPSHQPAREAVATRGTHRRAQHGGSKTSAGSKSGRDDFNQPGSSP